ncbi:MAG: UDP-3-O-(3-hydroxymyristoyl)glucosamine N-acyltransferase [Bacteroidia bacterium]|nr:UDP-3-O-(3-hydroxymyristoyl)glucosamine N-acyltransferase [Bacteroidia bacterium]
MNFTLPLKLKEVAELIKAEYFGDDNILITGINEIHKVSKGDLTFVDHPKYYKKALCSEATTIIINKKITPPEGKSLLFSNDPFRDYNYLVSRFSRFERCGQFISPTAEIGEGTVIQPGAFIGNHVTIGRNCLIHSNVSIYNNTIIGNKVIIHAGTVIGSDAFYYKRRADGYDKLLSCGNVIINDKVEIGANCTIDRGVSGDTIIGEGTKLDNLIQIGHDTVIGKNCLFAAQVGIAGVVVIEDNVILWGQVGVSKDLKIGKGAVVLAQSGVGKTLEGGKVYFGSPVIEARDKMKEIVYLRKLPELFNKK